MLQFFLLTVIGSLNVSSENLVLHQGNVDDGFLYSHHLFCRKYIGIEMRN